MAQKNKCTVKIIKGNYKDAVNEVTVSSFSHLEQLVHVVTDVVVCQLLVKLLSHKLKKKNSKQSPTSALVSVN